MQIPFQFPNGDFPITICSRLWAMAHWCMHFFVMKGYFVFKISHSKVRDGWKQCKNILLRRVATFNTGSLDFPISFENTRTYIDVYNCCIFSRWNSKINGIINVDWKWKDYMYSKFIISSYMHTGSAIYIDPGKS